LVGAAAALLVAALIGGTLSEPSAGAVPPYDPARFYPTAADFARSIAVYEQAIAADPRDGEAYFWLGSAYWLASEMYRLGLVSYGAGYLDKAITLLERATGIDEKNLGAWIVLVEAYRTRADRARGDPEKEAIAEARLIAAGFDLSVSTQAVPPFGPLR
jgi:tetratricopeptide (TPR) repeat protein